MFVSREATGHVFEDMLEWYHLNHYEGLHAFALYEPLERIRLDSPRTLLSRYRDFDGRLVIAPFCEFHDRYRSQLRYRSTDR